MNYTRPEITSLASASSVIQGTKWEAPTDGKQILDENTVSAYQADE